MKFESHLILVGTVIQLFQSLDPHPVHLTASGRLNPKSLRSNNASACIILELMVCHLGLAFGPEKRYCTCFAYASNASWSCCSTTAR
eukprot:848847-Amphidinium_carterae.1